MTFEQDKTVLTYLETPLDYIRYGVTQAANYSLWYGHGTDNAWDDLSALIWGSLRLPFDINPLVLQAHLTMKERQLLLSQLKKRIVDRIPVPYLTNEAYFCGEAYYVDERVLIPRSPIAELIERQFEPWIDADSVKHVLDLCTGSGCIAIACADAFPDATVDAVDISADALAVAEINVAKHHMKNHVTLIESDLWDALPLVKYDVIVSNPPYVSSQEMATLPEEYRHEPHLALEAKEAGLAIVKRILARALDYLSPHGILIVEVGNSESALMAAYPTIPFTWLDFERGGQGVWLLTAEQLRSMT